MEVFGIERLHKFKCKYRDVGTQVDAWLCEAKESQWNTPHDIKAKYASASFLADNQIVFNLKGGKYRLLIKVNYLNKIVLIKKIGTHEEYNRWNL